MDREPLDLVERYRLLSMAERDRTPLPGRTWWPDESGAALAAVARGLRRALRAAHNRPA